MHKSAHSSASARAAVEQAPTTPLAVLQLKRDLAAQAPGAQAQAPQAAMSGGRPLPEALRLQMESSLHADFSEVRVHEGSHVSGLGALAYTQGDQLHFAPGQYQPETRRGQQLIGHELAHVVQQRAGRVAPEQPLQGSGLAVNQDTALEAEADAAGIAAAQGEAAPVRGAAPGVAQAATSQSAVVQFYKPIAHAGYTLNQDLNDQHDPFTSQNNDPALLQPVPHQPLSSQIRFVRQAEATPDLLVSEDDTLAIQDTAKEPKEFYAAPNVLQQANVALQSKGSMFRLAHTGHSIDLGGGLPVLTRVQPHRDGQAVPQAAGEFADFVYHRCISLAARGMGKQTATDYKMDLILEGNGNRTTTPIDSTGIDSKHINRLAEYVGNNANVDKGSAVNALGGNHNPVSGQTYGTQSRNGGRDGASQELGINQHAKAQVGEGYGIYSLNSGMGKTDFSNTDINNQPVVRNFMWGYHYAAVVASSLDAQDTITLENYNRADNTTALLGQMAQNIFNTFSQQVQQACPMPGVHEDRKLQTDKYKAIYLKAEELRGTVAQQAEQNYNNAIKEESGKAWYFAIQGPQGGQSFHEKAVSSGFYANPMTVRVGRPDVELARIEYNQRLSAIPAIDVVAQGHPTYANYGTLLMAARNAIGQGGDRAAVQLAYQQHRATLLSAQLDLYFNTAAQAAVTAGLIPRVPGRPLGSNATLQWVQDMQGQLIQTALQTRRTSKQQRLQQQAVTLQGAATALQNLLQWVQVN